MSRLAEVGIAAAVIVLDQITKALVRHNLRLYETHEIIPGLTTTVFGYNGPTTFNGQTAQIANKNVLRSSVGAGLTWASPFGALSVNYAVPLSKAAYDVVQPFGFTAGGF